MERQKIFRQAVFKIAIPVTLQSLLQSSFSVIDQMMIGRLGSNSIAGIGLGGKFSSIYSVVLAAISTAAGIMISQYIGAKKDESVNRSFSLNLVLAISVAAVFLVACMSFPEIIMGIYTKNEVTRELASDYLRIFSVAFLPMAVSSIVTTMLRCMGHAVLPLYSSIFALVMNTGLNYMLIFGKWIFPEMGVKGAALATVLSQMISCGIILILFGKCLCGRKEKGVLNWCKNKRYRAYDDKYRKQYMGILCPMLACEFLWSLGENVYAAVYGNLGTDACAAMTMTIPIQTIIIGALSGLSQAAGILIGQDLGSKDYANAYEDSKRLMKYGFVGSIFLSAILAAGSSAYVRIYSVEPWVQEITREILLVFAIIAPVKVQNMILGGGVIRSGGRTKYIMWIDIIGTWLFGVPLAMISAFVWKLPIAYVYFALSLEECVRLGITLMVFRRKKWMESLK